jgi:hypothetical protein
MKMMRYVAVLALWGIGSIAPGSGISQDVFYPQVPFNILYAGGVEHTFLRVEHPQWDAVEFQTNASGRVQLLVSLLDGTQIHYLDEEPMVPLRKKFDTGSKPRDYRYAPMEYHSQIGKDGRVKVTASARIGEGKIDVTFFSSEPLKEMNQVVDPLNHAPETIAILHMERTASGDERTVILLDGKPLKTKKGHLSFVQGANFGIIFRTDKRVEKLIQLRPGERGWLGARWVYDLSGNRVTYTIEKEKDSEGYYEVKRVGNMMVQKAWLRPAKEGREVRRVSTYSLVHEDKEFVIQFEPFLFFPSSLEGKGVLKTQTDFRGRISNSGWAFRGRVKMDSTVKTGSLITRLEFLPSFPEFLAKRPIHYEVVESAKQYEVVATEK